MKSIVKLETFIHKFVEKHNGLRSERDRVVQEAEIVKSELKQAVETINKLNQNIKEVEKKSDNTNNIENKKNEIIHHIKSLVNRIDKLDLDDFTNA